MKDVLFKNVPDRNMLLTEKRYELLNMYLKSFNTTLWGFFYKPTDAKTGNVSF